MHTLQPEPTAVKTTGEYLALHNCKGQDQGRLTLQCAGKQQEPRQAGQKAVSSYSPCRYAFQTPGTQLPPK